MMKRVLSKLLFVLSALFLFIDQSRVQQVLIGKIQSSMLDEKKKDKMKMTHPPGDLLLQSYIGS